MSNIEKRVSKEFKKLISEMELNEVLLWGDNQDVTNAAHLERCIKQGIKVPQELIEYVRDKAPLYNAPPSEVEKVDIATSMKNPKYDHKTGQLYYFDPLVKMNLSYQSYESGFGVNGSNNRPGDWMRRFGNMKMDNKKAMARPYGICVITLCCSVDVGYRGAYFDCVHYAMDGSDEKIVGRLTFTEQDNQMAYATVGVRVPIPAFRRITIRIGGNKVSYPQGHYRYRQIIDLD